MCKTVFRQQVASDSMQTHLSLADCCHTVLSGALVSPSGFFEMKMKYDESDNAFIRVTRAVTDRVTDFVGKLITFVFLCSDWLMADDP